MRIYLYPIVSHVYNTWVIFCLVSKGWEVNHGYPAVAARAHLPGSVRAPRVGDSSVSDQALLDAQVPGGSAPALNDQGCQCVVSWRLGVLNVMTSRDAGWVGSSNERGAVCPAGRGYFGCLQSPWWRLALSGRNARGRGATGGGLGVLRVCGDFV